MATQTSVISGRGKTGEVLDVYEGRANRFFSGLDVACEGK